MSNDVPKNKEEEVGIPKARWKNMRRMAWLSLIAGLLYPALLLLGVQGETLVGVAPSFYMFVSAVVGAYMGFSTWGDKG